MADRWWRTYERARHDPKLLMLSDKNFRGWFNVICVASTHCGVLPSTAELALELRLSASATATLLTVLAKAGLLDDLDGQFTPHNWDNLQFKSDNSADRMRRHRQRRNGDGRVTSHVTSHVRPGDVTGDVTCDVTVTDSERRKKESRNYEDVITHKENRNGDVTVTSQNPSQEAKNAHGSRIGDWLPSPDEREFAHVLGLDPDGIFSEFADYWRAQPGVRGRKSDWPATWRNWCRRAPAARKNLGGSSPTAAGIDAAFARRSLLDE